MSKLSLPPELTGDPVENIDVDALKIGAVYAKALLGAAEAAGQTEAVIGEFDSLVTDVLDRFPQLEAVLASAIISPADKDDVLDKTLGKQASPLLLNFLKVVAKHGRLGTLRAIRRSLHEQHDQMRGRVRVRVTTATPLDDDVANRIADLVRNVLKHEPVLESAVESDMIGGVVLRVGDMVYDASIATQLAHIREQMINRSVHEIQSRRDRFRNPEGS
jgi:F-type H+-transporting ATPase subunit delta